MHKVTITVTNTKIGLAKLTSFPHRPDGIKYQVPLYTVTVKGKDKLGNSVEKNFKAIRFGVKRTKTLNAHMVGLQQAQSYILSWSWITTMKEMAWRVYDGFFVHRGPNNPMAGTFGSIGCIEICGSGEWDRFNNLIKELADCKTAKEVSTKRYAKIVYIAAIKPSLIKL
ncbi:hypothetical protein [uncultured Lacinutrix sp.]|uniref:hypothetical protein n=1 Tax=uncultured Lacinutrix sp. TaxID=574032 RepID=UPI002622E39E|nr:hypothetical protein [uncultured Lacinutrix sp.]